MQAARELFACRGINGTNSNEIASTAGVSIGTFYSYFENKKVLFLEILERYLDAFITGIYSMETDAAVPLRENIRSHIDKAFAAFDLYPSFHQEALVLKFSDPEVRRLFDEAEHKQLQLISSLLEPYACRKDSRDLEAAAKVIHSAVENIAHYITFLDSPMQKDRLKEELTEMIFHYVNSL